MSCVASLLEVLREDPDGGVEAVRLVPLYGASLHAQPPGIEASQQGRPGRRTLGVEVRLVQQHLQY